MSKNSVKTILITLYLSAVQDPEPLSVKILFYYYIFLGHPVVQTEPYYGDRIRKQNVEDICRVSQYVIMKWRVITEIRTSQTCPSTFLKTSTLFHFFTTNFSQLLYFKSGLYLQEETKLVYLTMVTNCVYVYHV